MTARPFTITSIHIPDPSRYGNARRTVAMIRGIVIALILSVLAIPFVTEAEAATSSEAGTAQITRAEWHIQLASGIPT